MLKFSRQNAGFRQPVAEIAGEKWTVGSFLTMDHQVIEIENLVPAGGTADVKAEFGSTSLVGNCVVFNIGGNKYRLATRILYPSQKVFVLKCMTHAEYDEDKWKAECGCYEPPPPKPGPKSKAVPTKRKKKGNR